MYIGRTPRPPGSAIFCASESFNDREMHAIQGLFAAESEKIRMVNQSDLLQSFSDFDFRFIELFEREAIFSGCGRARHAD